MVSRAGHNAFHLSLLQKRHLATYLRCLVLLKAAGDMTDTLPKHIIPQNVQVTMAQMQALNGSLMSMVTEMAQSMLMVTGG